MRFRQNRNDRELTADLHMRLHRGRSRSSKSFRDKILALCDITKHNINSFSSNSHKMCVHVTSADYSGCGPPAGCKQAFSPSLKSDVSPAGHGLDSTRSSTSEHLLFISNLFRYELSVLFFNPTIVSLRLGLFICETRLPSSGLVLLPLVKKM